MKPVFPHETRRQRALFAARLHAKSGTLLSIEAQRDVCEELLMTDLRGVPTSAPIEPGRYTPEGAKTHG